MAGKEPWDSSSEKAKELKIADFGSPEEVREMAKMPRTAKNRQETTEILKEIAKKGPIASKTGIVATLSSDSIGKIVSSKALNNSYSQMVHFHVAANIDKLFLNAIEPWKFELNPNKNNTELGSRRYLYAPCEYEDRIFPVKITVKEYKDQNLGKRLYSVEAIDVDLA
ncbi:hypothetical protein AGMMS49944_19770 [Spirochaetia bacterium]|nr:hypothetical protein AGMMS49944_19770 [Spirochaetia bacterium]